MAAEVSEANGRLEVNGVKKLFDATQRIGVGAYEPSADGRKFLIVSSPLRSTPPLTLVVNWMPGRK